MSEQARDDPQRLAGRRYENVDDYVAGLVAAIRTHQKLSGSDELRVEIEPEMELPLVQRVLLR